ncbi:MAG: thioredoxin-disulfide reductase [Peptococcaceae bacterium]|nr:thioredoxin-disulfide reductase [Candidatus Syntrophopropionicum ammoniitolerans]
MDKRDLVIIGGGPAGLTAGIYASRASIDTVILERGVPGGLVISTNLIENYPGFSEGVSGPDLMIQMEKQAKRFGCQIMSAHVEKIETGDQEFHLRTDSGEIITRAVILASGVQPQMLGVTGEKELIGRGVSYCATCDGPFYRNKSVAVIGGGDAAVEEAIFLTRFAEKVFVIHRRGELRAIKILQQRAFENPKIEFIWHSVADEILGQKLVEGIRVRDVRDSSKKTLKVNGVFIYVGNKPNSLLLQDLVKTDEKGYIVTDENMQTTIKGVFAAGDVRQKLLRQVVTAVADGATAAFAAEKHLTELK